MKNDIFLRCRPAAFSTGVNCQSVCECKLASRMKESQFGSKVHANCRSYPIYKLLGHGFCINCI